MIRGGLGGRKPLPPGREKMVRSNDFEVDNLEEELGETLDGDGCGRAQGSSSSRYARGLVDEEAEELPDEPPPGWLRGDG